LFTLIKFEKVTIMFTAAMFETRLIEVESCHGLDEWLETVVFQKFVRLRGKARSISIEGTLIGAMNWNHESFVHAVRARGFRCERTPESSTRGAFFTLGLPEPTKSAAVKAKPISLNRG
jgi:hypothetical protein